MTGLTCGAETADLSEVHTGFSGVHVNRSLGLFLGLETQIGNDHIFHYLFVLTLVWLDQQRLPTVRDNLSIL
jgi:hypothetical protein